MLGKLMPTRTLLVGNDDANTIQGGAGAELIYGFNPDGPQGTVLTIDATRVVSGLTQPLFVTAAPGEPDHLFIVEKTGRIKILDLTTGMVQATPFLDVSSEIDTAGEMGLLGLTFHPNYAVNHQFYIHLSNTDRDSEYRRYTANAQGTQADTSTEQLVLKIDYPSTTTNHRAGWLDFGPDGLLYIATGDGASDPSSAQRIDNLLGKILRLDVNADGFPADPTRNYAIPDDNPATIDGIAGDASQTGIFAAGLRNPFRSSFDRGLGDLFIGNVGGSQFEEINLGQPGANYGWPNNEGFFDQASFPDYTQPIYAYAHGSSASVTGGFVYRGQSEGLHGQYFFADFITGQVSTLNANGTSWLATDRTAQLNFDLGTLDNPSSFGEDAFGNLYVVDYGGEVFRLTPRMSSSDIGDTLRGGGGDDMMFGGPGADRLFGEADNDTLDGGADIDTAVFANARTAYQFQLKGTEIWVSGTSEGADRVLDTVELFQFADGTWARADLIARQPTIIGSGPDELLLKISQDAYQGDALYTIAVDGQPIGGTLTAQALHAAGQSDTVIVRGDWGPGDHQVGLTFVNDAYAGTPDTDRNLYLDQVTYNGAVVPGGQATLWSAGEFAFNFHESGGLTRLDWDWS
jgi:glucose/arabinose dehydrogenase